jgi:phosphomannomutase
MDTLIFGTDGWRDVIAERFTFSNLGRVAQAYADDALEQGIEAVVVGFDTRFLSAQFARHVAEVLAANGLRVLLAGDYLPTPALSFAVKHYGAGGGIMLTASHNPPQFHGFKLKGAYGGTATPEIYGRVSQRVPTVRLEDVKAFDSHQHAVETFDISAEYFSLLASQVDLEAIRTLEQRSDLERVHDAMGGSGTGWLRRFFASVGLEGFVTDLHPRSDPLFYGCNPEPIPQNLPDATLEMGRRSGVVLCNDGDADRIGVVLSGGTFFNSHQIFAVLLDHLHRKGLRGRVVKTFTVSRVVERLARARGLEVVETPVGFKYIVDAMLGGDVLIGGEESGGIGVAGHIPERDSLLNALLLLEAMATTGKTLDVLFSEIEREVGWQHAYDRLDLHLHGNALKNAVMNALQTPPPSFNGRTLESVERLDGVKLNLSGKAWLMFRASGTEPVLRVYCEAATPAEVQALLEAARSFVNGF